jgi:predicted N-acetyltransferase YhbS
MIILLLLMVSSRYFPSSFRCCDGFSVGNSCSAITATTRRRIGDTKATANNNNQSNNNIDSPQTLSKTNSNKLSYRTAKPSDIQEIARLLNDDDDDDADVVGTMEDQLNRRMNDMLTQKDAQPHAFLVATTSEDPTPSSSSTVVGFIELGTMPSPIMMEKEWNEVTISTRPELPFVANLVVAKSIRRQKVGYTLIQLALKVTFTYCTSLVIAAMMI